MERDLHLSQLTLLLMAPSFGEVRFASAAYKPVTSVQTAPRAKQLCSPGIVWVLSARQTSHVFRSAPLSHHVHYTGITCTVYTSGSAKTHCVKDSKANPALVASDPAGHCPASQRHAQTSICRCQGPPAHAAVVDLPAILPGIFVLADLIITCLAILLCAVESGPRPPSERDLDLCSRVSGRASSSQGILAAVDMFRIHVPSSTYAWMSADASFQIVYYNSHTSKGCMACQS